MNIRPYFASLAASIAIGAMSLAEGAEVKTVKFAPSAKEIKAAAGKPMPKTAAEETADTAKEVGQITRTRIPGTGVLGSGRNIADSGKKLGAIFGVGNSQSVRVLLAEEIQKHLGNGPVIVAFGKPVQTAKVLASLQSENFSMEKPVFFIAVDDSEKPLKGAWDKEYEEIEAEYGTPLVLFHTLESGAAEPAFVVNGVTLATAEGAKAAAVQLNGEAAPEAAPTAKATPEAP